MCRGGPNRWAWYALAYLNFWPSKKKKFQSLASPAQPVAPPAVQLHQLTPGTNGRPEATSAPPDPAPGSWVTLHAGGGRRAPCSASSPPWCSSATRHPAAGMFPLAFPCRRCLPDLSSQIPRPNPNRRPWRLAASMRDAPPPCRQDVAAPSLQVGASPPSGPGCPAATGWRPCSPAACLPGGQRPLQKQLGLLKSLFYFFYMVHNFDHILLAQ